MIDLTEMMYEEYKEIYNSSFIVDLEKLALGVFGGYNAFHSRNCRYVDGVAEYERTKYDLGYLEEVGEDQYFDEVMEEVSKAYFNFTMSVENNLITEPKAWFCSVMGKLYDSLEFQDAALDVFDKLYSNDVYGNSVVPGSARQALGKVVNKKLAK